LEDTEQNTEMRTKQRLDDLKKHDKGTPYTTQKENIQKLEDFNKKCEESWKSGDRVTALKIVIKCTKELSKNAVPQFYPSLFVLVTEVLDTFGRLVEARIKSKSVTRDYFTGAVNNTIGGNYFYLTKKNSPLMMLQTKQKKFVSIGSIKLHPSGNYFQECKLLTKTSYVEMTLLNCNRFLSSDDTKLKRDILRINKTIRGIGDPLISTYARLFLCKRVHELLPLESKTIALEIFKDFLFIRKQWKEETFIELNKKMDLKEDEYIDLYSPAIEWLLEMIGGNSDEELFSQYLKLYQDDFNKSNFLFYIINGFSSEVVAINASVLVYEINSKKDEIIPKYLFFKLLGIKINKKR
jgi:hypothetical protein